MQQQKKNKKQEIKTNNNTVYPANASQISALSLQMLVLNKSF